MRKLLREKYKTLEGARKRAAMENALAKGEYEQGYKAKHYRYYVTAIDGAWRIERVIHDGTYTGNATGGNAI